MNEHQSHALKHPGRFAFEALYPGQSYFVFGGSIVLSVNSGYE